MAHALPTPEPTAAAGSSDPGPPQGRRRRLRRRIALAAPLIALVALAATLLSASPAKAASLSLTYLDASVSGQNVTVTSYITADATTFAVRYGVCVRDSAGANRDFPLQEDVSVPKSGALYTRTKAFSAGTYWYGVCVYTTAWVWVGDAKQFTVGAQGSPGAPATTAPTTTAPPVTAPASVPTGGSSMPVGNLPGWRQVLADDFTTPVALGGFPRSTYAQRWFSYTGTDTTRNGRYDSAKVLSVSNGVLDYYLRTEGGTRYVAAITAMNPETGWGQTYGRYSVRFRADVMPQYKMAFLLWPDSDNWGEGEIDFPEATTFGPGGKIYANLYTPGAPGRPAQGAKFISPIDAGGTGWHVATVDWSPGRITWYLDGAVLGTTTQGVPSTKMHWVLQVETSTEGGPPAASVAGRVQVDWATMYAYNP